MDIKSYLKEKKPLIDKEIEKIFPKKINGAWLELALGKPLYKFDEKTLTKTVAEPIWEFLNRGGKRWRPALTLLACEAVGGNEKNALPFTPLPELIHSGTIAADDLEDNSKERRGKPCMHLLYGADIALNDSNLMYFLPLITLYRNLKKLDEKTKSRIYDLYAEEMIRVSTGQALDISWHKEVKFDVSEQEYLQMVVSKTGVLARMAAMLGAIIGKGSEKQIQAFGKFGMSLGIGFQIQDDILNISPASKDWGKEVGDDINEGKITLLVIKTLEKANAVDKKKLVEILKKHTENKAEIKEAIEIIKKYGAIEYAQKKAEEAIASAWKELEKQIPESNAKTLLKELADYAVKREI